MRLLCVCMVLPTSHQPGIMMLKDRLYHAQGEAAVRPQPPNSSNRVGVSTARPTPAAQTPAPKAQLMVWSYFLQDEFFMHFVNVWTSLKPFGFFFSNLRVSTSHPLLSAYSLLYHRFLPHQLLQPTRGLVCHLSLICHPVQPALPWGRLTLNILLQLQVWIWLFACRCVFQIPRDSKCFSFSGFLPHQPFQPQHIGRHATFPTPGPSVPLANLSGPPLQPSSSTPGGMPPMPSPGVPLTTFMPSTSLASGLMPPSSQTGGRIPMYPGGLQNPLVPPGASDPYASHGPGYPQGGPGAPAVKPFQPPGVVPPPAGWLHVYS